MNLDMYKYLMVKKAVAAGAKTLEDMKKVPGFTIESEEEAAAVEVALKKVNKCIYNCSGNCC